MYVKEAEEQDKRQQCEGHSQICGLFSGSTDEVRLEGGERVILVLLVIIALLLALFISTKLGLAALVAWMEENRFRQPSDKDIKRLIGWCAKKYVEDLFRKS